MENKIGSVHKISLFTFRTQHNEEIITNLRISQRTGKNVFSIQEIWIFKTLGNLCIPYWHQLRLKIFVSTIRCLTQPICKMKALKVQKFTFNNDLMMNRELREHTLSMKEGNQIFQKKFVAQETIDLNILCPSNFFWKMFLGPSHQFYFLI